VQEVVEEADSEEMSMVEDDQEEEKLNKKERVAMLRDHPVLAARLFEMRARILFDEVFHGADKPFGKITDFWGRVEFQGAFVRRTERR
jgi:Helitron helicase-like domain at N-terminus